MKLAYENLLDVLMMLRGAVRLISLGAIVVSAFYLFGGYSRGEPFFIKIFCIIGIVQFFFVRALYDRAIHWAAAKCGKDAYLSH